MAASPGGVYQPAIDARKVSLALEDTHMGYRKPTIFNLNNIIRIYKYQIKHLLQG